MTRENAQHDPFDPTAPIGQPIGRADEPLSGPAPLAPLSDPPGEKADPGDEALLRLIDRATRPPAGLRLDRGRLRAAIAAEPMRQASQPAKIRPPFWHVRIWRVIPLAAAAGLLLVASLLVLHQPGEDTGTKIAVLPSGGNQPGHVGQPGGQPTLAVGLSPSEASQLVENRPKDLVIVVTRLTDQPQPANHGEDQGPLPNGPVLTDTAPLAGTAYGDEGSQASDLDNPDTVLLSFDR